MQDDPRGDIRTIGPGAVAVRRFSGFSSEDYFDEHESRLLGQLRKDGLEIAGTPPLDRYNGPFTPWFPRRNEIMVEVDWPDS